MGAHAQAVQAVRRAVRYRLGGQQATDSSNSVGSAAGTGAGAVTLSPLAVETRLLRLPPAASTATGASVSISKLLPSSFLLLNSGGGGGGSKAGNDEDEADEGPSESGSSGSGGSSNEIKRLLALRRPQPLAAFGLWDGQPGGGVRLRCVFGVLLIAWVCVVMGRWLVGVYVFICILLPRMYNPPTHTPTHKKKTQKKYNSTYPNPSTVLNDLRANARALLLRDGAIAVDFEKQRVRLPVAVWRYWEVCGCCVCVLLNIRCVAIGVMMIHQPTN